MRLTSPIAAKVDAVI